MKVCLMTGVPGVGKTSVCAGLTNKFPKRYRHLPFGRLIRQVLSEAGEEISEKALRQDVTAFVTPAVLAAATDELIRQTHSGASSTWTLIDSHAVSQDWYGYLVTPDGSAYFSRVKYDAIVNLYADEVAVLARSHTASSGRRALTAADVALHAQLQAAVSIQYASYAQCPLYFISADTTLEDVVSSVDRILDPRGHQEGSAG